MEALAGKLLVASPTLLDPNFHRSVVLLCAHGAEGAFGVILNRPLGPAAVGDRLPEWRERLAEPAVLFGGGPVEPATALALGHARGETNTDASGWTPLTGPTGPVALGTEAGELAAQLTRVRVFAGHAGWGAHQLEAEIAQGAWFVVEARAEDIFTDAPERLWQRVLRRQPGDLVLQAFYPPDLRLN
jgi:putative transcriptional regulator